MFSNLYNLLYAYYGNLKWWPSETDDETVIGCILTQNTSWKNVEKAIEKMKSEHIDTLIEITRTDNEKLKDLIRSSGFYNQKSRYLSAVARAIIEKYGNLGNMKNQNHEEVASFISGLPGVCLKGLNCSYQPIDYVYKNNSIFLQKTNSLQP